MSHIINPVAPYLSRFQGEWSILMESKKSEVKPNADNNPGRDASGLSLHVSETWRRYRVLVAIWEGSWGGG